MSPKNNNLKKTGLSLGERIAFTRTLYVMLKSGLSMNDALHIFEQQATKKVQPLIQAVAEAVEGGTPLSAALSVYPKAFPDIYIRLVHSGEISGRMEETLKQLVAQLRATLSLKNKIRNALAYPSVIVLSMLLIGSILVVVVLPRMVELYAGSSIALPWPTRLVIFLTQFGGRYWYILLFVGVALALCVSFARTQPWGKLFFSRACLTLPIAKSLTLRLNNTRLLRTLQGLLATDIPIVQSMKLLSTTTRNVVFQRALQDISQRLKEGESIASSFARYPKLFPPLAQQMIVVGEQAGSIEENLDDLATFYEEELELELQTLTVLIEPLLILVIGGAVGVVAFAVIWPMYSLVNQI